MIRERTLQAVLGDPEEVIVPDGVETIGDGALYECMSLTTITLPNSVREIGADAFSNCRHLRSVTLPDGLRTIDANAFASCVSLTEVTIPDSVGTIEMYAFYDSEALTKVILPRSVKIGYYAFTDCTSLTDITLPNQLEQISGMAFLGCDSLSTVTLLGEGASRFPAPSQYKGLLGEALFEMCRLFDDDFRRNGISNELRYHILCTLLVGGYQDKAFLAAVKRSRSRLLRCAVEHDDVPALRPLLTIGTITDETLEAALARAADCGAKESYLVLVNEKQKRGLLTEDEKRL